MPKPSGMMDLKMMAISRLMLDNFPHIKAYWVMLGLKTAQVALSLGPMISTAPSFTRKSITKRRRTPQEIDRCRDPPPDQGGRPDSRRARYALSSN